MKTPATNFMYIIFFRLNTSCFRTDLRNLAPFLHFKCRHLSKTDKEIEGKEIAKEEEEWKTKSIITAFLAF